MVAVDLQVSEQTMIIKKEAQKNNEVIISGSDTNNNNIENTVVNYNAMNDRVGYEDLMAELKTMKENMTGVDELKDMVIKLKCDLDDAFDVISSQMRFIGLLDAKDKDKKLVIIGLEETREAPLAILISDLLRASGFREQRLSMNADNDILYIDNKRTHIRRLGQLRDNPNSKRNRPILFEIPNRKCRDDIMQCAPSLKFREGYKRVFFRKDLHPVLRKEQARLKKLIYDEKMKPSNSGRHIRFSLEKQAVVCDNEVVDRFRPKFD